MASEAEDDVKQYLRISRIIGWNLGGDITSTDCHCFGQNLFTAGGSFYDRSNYVQVLVRPPLLAWLLPWVGVFQSMVAIKIFGIPLVMAQHGIMKNDQTMLLNATCNNLKLFDHE